MEAGVLSFTYEALSGRQSAVKRGSTTLSGFTWATDGTLTSRLDDGIGTSTFGYDRLDRPTTMASPLWTGSATFGWRPDGLIDARAWPTGTSATFEYDGLKRPVAMTESSGGSPRAVFGQTYDRAGNVTSDSRSLSGISGAAGMGTQTFAYDGLRRVISATLAGSTTSYTYDASGNRTGVTAGGVTTAYTYDRADQLVSKKVGADPASAFAYDAYGNLLTSRVAASGATTYTYDAADRLTAIDAPGASNTVSFSFDALGRNRTRSVDGSLADTYGYLGESETVVRLDRTVDVLSAVSADGSRLAVKAGSDLGWTLPDLHGSMAALVSGDGSGIGDAFRYDAYGQTAASVTSSLPTPWRYQGNLLLTEPGTTDLYENGARTYDPGLGTFTQLDSVVGSAQNPLSLNRYLYAWANPATLTDPTGHCPWCGPMIDGEVGGSGAQRLAAAYGMRSPATKPPTVSRPSYDMRNRIHRFEAEQDRRRTLAAVARASVQTAANAVRTKAIVANFRSKYVEAPAARRRAAAVVAKAVEARQQETVRHGWRRPEAVSVVPEQAAGGGIDPHVVGLGILGGIAAVVACIALCLPAAAVVGAGTLAVGAAAATTAVVTCIKVCQRLQQASSIAVAVSGSEAGVPVGAAASVAARARTLQMAVPEASRGRVTMAVGLARDGQGNLRTIIGTSEPRGYLRPGVSLSPGEILATGTGHAEVNVVQYMRAQGWTPLTVGAGRPICATCAEVIQDSGASFATETRLP